MNNQSLSSSFKPSYVWPNPAFPFKLYYESDKCRIFLIENIVHNWNWLSKYSSKFKSTDYFFVQLGWYFSDWLIQECSTVLEVLGLKKSNFYIMFPDFPTKNLFESYGFTGEIINHNCFLDENKFKIIQSQKFYDAVYVARFSSFKRHFLAEKVNNLALIAGPAWGAEITDIPKHVYLNEKPLDSDQVVEKLSQSKVGLLLSEFEGACYSSSEYLLCGLPVVSTWSHGGRSLWYNDYNSIVCDANPDDIAESVAKLIKLDRNREKIRNMHINLSMQMRFNFIKMHQVVLDICSDNSNAEFYFFNNFKHKLLYSHCPDFDVIFG